MTETSGVAFGLTSPDEYHPWGSVGKLTANCEARIVDPDTGVALPPSKQGELWIKGPIVMKGKIYTIIEYDLHNIDSGLSLQHMFLQIATL